VNTRWDWCDNPEGAAKSVLSQTYDDIEHLLVATGNESVCERLREDYGSHEMVQVHCNPENVGLLESRNTATEAATGDVIAVLENQFHVSAAPTEDKKRLSCTVE
jgi:CTP:molybdopterin cytidylyltransferase MocA